MVEALRLFAGVDAGASHTTAVVGDQQGAILARRRGGPGNLLPGQAQQRAREIGRLIEASVQQAGGVPPVESAVVGAAGAGRERERQDLERELAALGVARRVSVVTDAAAALESAFPGQFGIVLLAGTGSIALGRDSQGRVYRVGGWGWQFGDEGSGYALARAALAAVFRAADGRGPDTRLTRLLPEACGVTTVEDLAAWARERQPGEIAALAARVCEAAREDPVAALLAQGAAAELAHQVDTLLRRLSNPRIPVALSGGLLSGESPVRQTLVALLSAKKPPVNLVEAEVDPARGALFLAIAQRD